ncbi:hypothetical protein [Nocardia sp. NPDC052566]|uniref:hypothetical protein n=1 Tax=Nocardia sp. NPDC052566 TaxID=3364330 RepID=UPI0037CCB1FD
MTPPILVDVWPDRIWPPVRVRRQNIRLWHHARGLRLNAVVAGELTELVITQAGDLLFNVIFSIPVDNSARTESMLLRAGLDMWAPSSPADRQRLAGLVAEFVTGTW